MNYYRMLLEQRILRDIHEASLAIRDRRKPLTLPNFANPTVLPGPASLSFHVDSPGSLPLEQEKFPVEWKRTQKSAFVNWANRHLEVANMHIYDLETDLSDGLKLPALVEVLSGKKIPRFNRTPAVRVQKQENIAICLEFLQKDQGIKLINIDSSDVINQNSKLILALMWMLIQRYSIEVPMPKGGNLGELSPDQTLLHWFRERLPDVTGRNSDADWSDRAVIGTLENYFAPGKYHTLPEADEPATFCDKQPSDIFPVDQTDVICGGKPGELSREQAGDVCNFQDPLKECSDSDQCPVDKSPIGYVDDIYDKSRESSRDDSSETCRTDDTYDDILWSEFSDDQSTAESSEIESESHRMMKGYKKSQLAEYGDSGAIRKALEGCTLNKACFFCSTTVKEPGVLSVKIKGLSETQRCLPGVLGELDGMDDLLCGGGDDDDTKPGTYLAYSNFNCRPMLPYPFCVCLLPDTYEPTEEQIQMASRNCLLIRTLGTRMTHEIAGRLAHCIAEAIKPSQGAFVAIASPVNCPGFAYAREGIIDPYNEEEVCEANGDRDDVIADYEESAMKLKEKAQNTMSASCTTRLKRYLSNISMVCCGRRIGKGTMTKSAKNVQQCTEFRNIATIVHEDV